MTSRRSHAGAGTDPDWSRGEMLETVLPNGIRVLTESIPGVRSVSAGVWVRQGAAHETPDLFGGESPPRTPGVQGH